MSNNKKKTISIVGTNGIPARYGGFETLAEHLTHNLKSEFDFVVYCSKTQKNKLKEYDGIRLINIPLKANGASSFLYDIISLVHASFGSDLVLYLGPGAGFFLPILKLFSVKFIVNHGGLNEWKRSKYSSFQKFLARIGHKYGALSSVANIADNELLQESLKSEFGVPSVVIRYGGDHVILNTSKEEYISEYPFLNEQYYVNVSRAQIDNNLHIVLSAFENLTDKKLVMISNWHVSEYGRKLKEYYSDMYSNIVLLDAIYDSKKLNVIRANAKVYIHSHSYCGTAPSLVEAMSLGLPVVSFDVPTNRETTQSKSLYFSDIHSLNRLISETKDEDFVLVRNKMKSIAEKNYTWKAISRQYSEIFNMN